MRALNFTKASPGGNITILIWDEVEKDEHANLANILMDCEKHLGAEQVGYVQNNQNTNSVAHLQMMGGEFCGNAARTLAFMLVKKKYNNIKYEGNIAKFSITVSGVSHSLNVEVECDDNKNPLNAKVEMPIYSELDSVCSNNISQVNVEAKVVKLEGITHIIVDKSEYAFQQEDKKYQEQLETLRDELNLNDSEAVGVMWKSTNLDSFHIDPVVWVKNTNSFYYETSCGSGTIALALSLAKENTNSYQEFKIHQPSGKYITAIVQRDENKFINAYIKGEVEVIAEGVTYV